MSLISGLVVLIIGIVVWYLSRTVTEGGISTIMRIVGIILIVVGIILILLALLTGVIVL